MLCPRCATDLHTTQAKPRPDAAALSVDTCAVCSGLWLDGGELGPALAALGGLPSRMAEIAEIAVPASFACPRCRGLMLAFDLLDTPIDLCRDCGGVWLDGGEFAALAAHREPPRPALPKEVACAACRAVTAFGATYYSDRGLVCRACHETTDSPEAIAGRSADARRAYAAYAGEQGRIMAHNREPDRSRNLEEQVDDLRSEIRYLHRKIED